MKNLHKPLNYNPKYYPFGSVLGGRNGNSSIYKYGYQGSEKDDEVKGAGNSYTTEYRFLDPRLGRWLSLDPYMEEFSDLSPYNLNYNNPILHIDPNGDCPDGNCGDAQIEAAEKFVRQNFDPKHNLKKIPDYQKKFESFIKENTNTVYGEDGDNYLSLDGSDSPEKAAFGNLVNEIMDSHFQVDKLNPMLYETYINSIDQSTNLSDKANFIKGRIVAAQEIKRDIMLLNVTLFINFETGTASSLFKGSLTTAKMTGYLLKAKIVTNYENVFSLIETHSVNISGSRYKNLLKSIKSEGVKESIKFVEHRGKKYVVDGHHRLRAAKQLKLKYVPSERVSLPYKGYKNVEDLMYGN